MKVHHLNCATLCPMGGRLVSGQGGLFGSAKLVCHVVVLEAARGLVLIDTGLSLADVTHPIRRLGPGFMALTRPQLRVEETAKRQLEKLGLKPGDVRDIVLTHLDLDHAGGIGDFPQARVHVFAPELEAAMHPRSLNERGRYRSVQWAHRPSWVRHTMGRGEAGRWHGFESVRALDEGDPEVLIVPLLGHTRGHAGVAIKLAEGGSLKWLFHAGDAYFHHGEMREPPECPPGIAAIERYDDIDHAARVTNQGRLRALVREHAGEVRVFCAHDASELERLQAGR